MRTVLVLLSLVLSASCAHRLSWDLENPPPVHLAPEQQPRQPVLVLIELNPWLMVVGSDSPRFVLYDDGAVIYIERDWLGRYVTATLSDKARDELLESIGPARLDVLSERYEIAPFHDLETTVIVTFRDGKPRGVSVYGPVDTPRQIEILGRPSEKPVPPAFLDVLHRIREFRAPQAAVVMSGRKVALYLRNVFPGEALWRSVVPDAHP